MLTAGMVSEGVVFCLDHKQIKGQKLSIYVQINMQA